MLIRRVSNSTAALVLTLVLVTAGCWSADAVRHNGCYERAGPGPKIEVAQICRNEMYKESREIAMNTATDQAVLSLKLGWTRCYLLRCTGGYLLIDTDYPKHYPRFKEKLANLGIATSDIKYLLITHHHDDHAGFASELVRSTGCKVIAHRNALSALERGRSEDGGRPFNRRLRIVLALYMLYAKFFEEWNFPPLTLTERDTVIEGDNDDFLKGIGIDGVILHTPGHTRDSISVLLCDGSAFVGDAAMNFLRWTGVGHRPIYIEDINTVYESWRKLREHGAKVIYPAHGKSFSAAKLDKWARHVPF
ncbi:MAG: MBL fold metallo-hydrolase [Phycisphaerales bacterium]|nr:MAG: MBL fold metallo-hydrolase [Phycisphaerales bacterium]